MAGQDRIPRVERNADGHGLAVIELIFRQLLELVRGPMAEIQRTRRPQFEGITAEPDLAHVKLGADLDLFVGLAHVQTGPIAGEPVEYAL